MRKYIFLIILLTGSLLLFYSPSRQVLAITVEELQQQIQALQQIINQLLQQLKQLQATQPVTTTPITSPGLPQGQYCFTTTLCPGTFSEEVKKLQTVLGVQPVDGYFDYRTKLAVEKFQRDNGIQVTGCTGPLTRAKLNELFCKPSPTPIVEPECNTDSDCTWCGGCIAKKRVPIGGLCPDLAKPSGMDCRCISGKCTLSQVSPTTTTTKVANRYSCRTVPATIPSNISQMCIPDPNGPFSSLEECQKVCGSDISCVDSDGGINIFTKGTVISKGIQYTDTCEQCVAPNCVPGTTSCKASCTAVKEYFCQGGTVQATTYLCPPNYECIDGACKQISSSSIKVISPNGGEKWKMGETYEIRWSSTNLPSDSEVNIQLSYIYAGATSPLEASVATQIKNSGSYRWTIPTTGVIAEILGKSDPNAYQIRVVTPNNPYLGDYSDGYFTILPPPPSSVLSCNDLAITFYRRFYLDMCKGKGFDKVCFDKYTGEFQGCGKSTYNDCTVNNINANRNIWCDIQPSPLTATMNGPAVLNVYQIGAYKVTPSGGVPPYYYEWSASGLVSTPAPNEDPGTATYKWEKEGTYQIVAKVTDSAKNTYTVIYTVTVKNIGEIESCTDSDGGFNIYTKGYAKDRYGGPFYETCWDTVKNEPTRYSQNILEHYCIPNNDRVQGTLASCPSTHICFDGACVNKGSDSDNSPDYSKISLDLSNLSPTKYPDFYVKGEAKGKYIGSSEGIDVVYGLPPNPEVAKISNYGYSIVYDYCLNGELIEGYITKEGLLASIGIKCPAGYTCQNGACVLQSTTPTTTKPTTGNCGWCGNECTRITVGMVCPQVLPPDGYECKEINGVCTPINTTIRYQEIMEILKKLTASLYDLLNTIRR